jgi:hypothetical protein
MKSTSKQRSFRAEREFGLVVGGVFLLLGAWWLYRGRFLDVSRVFMLLGTALVLLGAALPRALIYPNKAWMKLAEVLAFVMTRVILGIVFFFIVTPIGVTKRLFGWDPLQRRTGSSPSYWRPYTERQRNTRHYEKMY